MHDKNVEDMFDRVELAWKNAKGIKRRYFLNLNFLVFNLGRLFGHDLKTIHGPSIKDPNRLQKQKNILKKLFRAINPRLEKLYVKSESLSVQLEVIRLFGRNNALTTNN